MLNEPIAFHVIFSTHGFWLPNDPRGSGSKEVHYESLRAFGPATFTHERRSVAKVRHNFQLRRAAKRVLRYPEVTFTGHQALAVAHGFRKAIERSQFTCWACCILPQHVHMVLGTHSYSIEQVVRQLKQLATLQLIAEELHPFIEQRLPSGYLPSVWAQDFWKVFLFGEDDVLRTIQYVEQNPVCEGKPKQKWSFVVPYSR